MIQTQDVGCIPAKNKYTDNNIANKRCQQQTIVAHVVLVVMTVTVAFVKDLPKVLMWRLELDSNLPSTRRKALSLPLSHNAPQCHPFAYLMEFPGSNQILNEPILVAKAYM